MFDFSVPHTILISQARGAKKQLADDGPGVGFEEKLTGPYISV